MQNSAFPLLIGLMSMCLACKSPSPAQPLLEKWMSEHGGLVGEVMQEADRYQVQILYTQIDRDAENRPSFRSYAFRVDSTAYFYPASTVKLPTALMALEKLNQLGIEGLNKFSPMLTDSAAPGQSPAHRDSSAQSGLPSVAHYIKKILLVSDNDAFNRLYEFLGQGPLNQGLWEKGYDLRIVHRLSIPLSQEANRLCNPIRFYASPEFTQTPVYQQAMHRSLGTIQAPEPIRLGRGEIQGDSLIMHPKDFATKNYFPLSTQQEVLKATIFPNSVNEKKRFTLSDGDKRFLYQYLSFLPRESTWPVYDSSQYYDGYAKFFMYGDTQARIPDHIRIFNKIGVAYGWATDNAYIVDFDAGVEFLLSASIYTNENGIFNDNAYEYEEIALPFLAELGRMIYHKERQRVKAFQPDFSMLLLQED